MKRLTRSLSDLGATAVLAVLLAVPCRADTFALFLQIGNSPDAAHP